MENKGTGGNIIISIGRQFGAGGRRVGQALAKELGIVYYDKELIMEAAKEFGFAPDFFEENDEKSASFSGNVLQWMESLVTSGMCTKNYLSQDTLFEMQSEVVRKVAEKHSCVIVGRCSDYVLRDNPNCISVFNVIIMRSFFYGIPDSLRESAEIDGASFFRILWSIYLPLSKPVLATLALFYAVGRWNGYSDALMYMRDDKFYTLQLLLYNIINNINQVEVATQEGFSTPGLSASLKAAIVMFSTIPILCIYPFLQKYFIHGVTMGAVKE